MIINENGVELKGKDVVADYFCNYFSHFSTAADLESPESLFGSYKDYLPSSENSSMVLAPVTFGEFQKVILLICLFLNQSKRIVGLFFCKNLIQL